MNDQGSVLATYNIEDIGIDHPSLLTAHLEASVVARCRESGGAPWMLRNHCDQLPAAGSRTQDVSLVWQAATDSRADQVARTYPAICVTEDAAIGACAAVFAAFAEREITEVTQHGTGVDYWVDQRRAVVEISGLRTGDGTALQQRYAAKQHQLLGSSLRRLGYPGYVFVVTFGGHQAFISYHP